MDHLAEGLEEGDAATAAAAAAPREVELKLFVPAASVARLWEHPLLVEKAIDPLHVARIDNRYFDTAERDLSRARMALRLRRIGRRWVQTLKVADANEGALSTRGEWEMPVAGAALELARLRGTPLTALGTARSLAARLQPVFTTNFRRESRLLQFADGAIVEFAFDVGVIASGRGRTRRTLPICEVELEVKGVGPSGAVPDLLRFAARLARDLPLIPLAASKAERGHRLALDRRLEPVRTALPDPRERAPAAAHLAAVVAACQRAVLGNVHALFEQAAEPDAAVEFVHQARVAVRRLRGVLRMFPDLIGAKRVDRLEAQLQAVGATFGRARDWDVFATESSARVDAEVAIDDAGRSAIEGLRVDLQARRIAAHRMLMRELDTGAFGATAIAVERCIERLRSEQDGRDDGTLADRAPAWLSTQRMRIVRRARRIATLDADGRHGLRVEVKRLRYGLDLFGALYDRKAVEHFQDALADLQDKLGKLNDAVVAESLIRSLPPSAALALITSRFEDWLAGQTRKQLPKVAALSVELELTPAPWLPIDATSTR